jgi:hypothetical protein
MYGSGVLDGVYSDDETEFFRHVYNPLTDPTFRAGTAMHSATDLAPMDDLVESMFGGGGQGNLTSDDDPVAALRRELIDDPELVDMLRLLVAKTETQLSIDLSLAFRGTESPVGDPSLCGCDTDELTTHTYSYFKNFLRGSRRNDAEVRKAAETIANYFENIGALDVLEDFAELPPTGRHNIIEEAILPHDGRQSRAKRQGHGAEAEIARVLDATGAEIRPRNKIANPMAGDVEFEGQSYDLLVEDDDGNTRVGIIGLFHTSNPGQYGVSKTAETEKYTESIANYNQRVRPDRDCELWSFCDGAGFAMNSAALRNVMDNVDDWIQIKSLWKLPVALDRRGVSDVEAIRFSDFYTAAEVRRLDDYLDTVDVLTSESAPSGTEELEAGEATLYV